MRIRPALPIALAVVSVAAAITLTVELRKNAPPEPARLLPSADAFLYADFGWARKLNGGKPFFPVTHDPEYEQFIQQTGFDFERDLDGIAFAIHYPASWPGGGTAGAAPEPRFSEVLTGRFDGKKCAEYLRQKAKSIENYDAVDIYNIPLYGRSFRIAILGIDTVAASNHDDPAVLHGIVDRSRRLASPFGGPAFLRRYYKRVQLASPIWIVARIEPRSPQFEGWSAVFPKPADLVVSASFNPLHLPLHAGSLHLRAEAWADSDENARSITDKVNVMLAMFHNAEVSVGYGADDADVKTFFDSLKVHQEDSRAILFATLPTGIFHKILSEGPQLPTPASTGPVKAR